MRRLVRDILAVLAVTVVAVRASFGLHVVSVPEIDSAMSIGALTLLGGAIMVIRGRSRR